MHIKKENRFSGYLVLHLFRRAHFASGQSGHHGIHHVNPFSVTKRRQVLKKWVKMKRLHELDAG